MSAREVGTGLAHGPIPAATQEARHFPCAKTVTLSANTSWYLFNFRRSTITALVAAGYRVVCLTPEDAYSERLRELGSDWYPLPMDNAGSNPFKDAMLVRRFWRYYRALRPSAAFHFTVKNNVYGTWAAWSLGIPAVSNVSGLGTAFIRKGIVPAAARMLYRLSQPLAYRVFCQNDEDHRTLVDRRVVPHGKLRLLPGSGVDLLRFHPSLRDAGSTGPFRFLYAGRMLTDKGLNELVEAITGINSHGVRCTLSLCGFVSAGNVSAISQSTIDRWTTRPGILFLGPSDAMETVYARADCVVLPSYREGMPRSLLEAGAMGLPVVATNVPGCRSIISDGVNGLLCEARDVPSLQEALERMLGMPVEDRARMGNAGRARVEAEFDETLVVQAVLQVLEGLK